MRKIAATSVGLLALALAGTPAVASDSDGHHHHPTKASRAVSVQVEFDVMNVNRSKLACATDGAAYTIRGHIVGPAKNLEKSHSVALYLHGLELGEFFWTYNAKGPSFVERQAQAGHTSVVIDRLGYDASGKPDGMASCLGGQADIANQIVDDLRSGSYRMGDSGEGIAFGKVVLGGHSVGGLLSELTAESFHNVDGVIVASYSDTVVSDATKATAAANAAACAAGGQRTEGGDFPNGYAPFAPTVVEFKAGFFLSADAADIAGVAERRNLNPCGDTATFAAAAATNVANIGSIDVPVLVIIGSEDALFPQPAGSSQRDLFTGSPSVTLRELSPSSHAVTIEATAPEFSQRISDWLDEQDL
jgi:pimeloyl-ACP methyl ester carboxylesterase